MKIVIDIPDEIMEYLRNNGCLSVIYTDEVAKAIITGTPYEEKTGYWILKEEAPHVARLHCSECDGVGYTFLPSCPYCRSIMTRIEE